MQMVLRWLCVVFLALSNGEDCSSLIQTKALPSADPRLSFRNLTERQEEKKLAKLNHYKSLVRDLPQCWNGMCRNLSTNPLYLQYTIVADAMMYREIWGIGGCAIALGVAAIFLASVYIEWEASPTKSTQSDESGSSTGDMDMVEFPGSMWLDYWCSWWWLPPDFAHPVMSMKLFVAMMLFWELFALSIPSASTMAVPELLRLERGHPIWHRDKPDVNLLPPWTFWLMPNLTEDTALDWVATMGKFRTLLILSWCGFLIFPQQRVAERWASWVGSKLVPPRDIDVETVKTIVQWGSGLLYGCGALMFAYLGIIGMMYRQAHDVGQSIHFALAGILAVPFLETNPRANTWLRKFLLINVLVPPYLFAFCSKVRYMGVEMTLSGWWLQHTLAVHFNQVVVLPGLNHWLADAPWTCWVFAWCNVAVELVLPWLVMLTMTMERRWEIIRQLFLVGIVGFHLSILILFSPNFLRQVVLVAVACDPFQWKTDPASGAPSSPSSPSSGDRLRGAWAFLVMAGSFATPLWSDFAHLTGYPNELEHEPYFPFAEWPMFTRHYRTELGYYPSSLFLIVAVLASFLYKMRCDIEDAGLNASKDS